jgi:Mg-chelatase subunit ChlI
MTSSRAVYPFAALVGQQTMQLALLLNAVNPRLGGVLIRGEKGTAKSTAARGLAQLLPPLLAHQGCAFACTPDEICPQCEHPKPPQELRPTPLVNLPLGATEDRVVGTLNLERAIADGQKAFEPGLLAQAHRGILYVDEVNLLEDHLVDVLLDAAAMGVNSVEREGMSVSHAARFMLIGTMNPEEGELRPQFLDRFGLCVAVQGILDPDQRSEVVHRCLAFENDPAAFAVQWEPEAQHLRERIMEARRQLEQVNCPDPQIDFACRVTTALDVQGHRADITLIKAAQTLAAWEGRASVLDDDIRRTAALVLPHRMRRDPTQEPELDQRRLERALAGV